MDDWPTAHGKILVGRRAVEHRIRQDTRLDSAAECRARDQRGR
jgi:hypothetical protein